VFLKLQKHQNTNGNTEHFGDFIVPPYFMNINGTRFLEAALKVTS
jgi:hypothetical protein